MPERRAGSSPAPRTTSNTYKKLPDFSVYEPQKKSEAFFEPSFTLSKRVLAGTPAVPQKWDFSLVVGWGVIYPRKFAWYYGAMKFLFRKNITVVNADAPVASDDGGGQKKVKIPENPFVCPICYTEWDEYPYEEICLCGIQYHAEIQPCMGEKQAIKNARTFELLHDEWVKNGRKKLSQDQINRCKESGSETAV